MKWRMKVMCIDDTHWYKGPDAYSCPSFGEVVTVVNSIIHPFDGTPKYEFKEYPPRYGDRWRLFSQKYFAPLSDIDEKERSLIGKVPKEVVESHMEYVRNLVEKIKPDL